MTIRPFIEIDDLLTALTGGKAAALARLIRNGFNIPNGFCIGTDCYLYYLQETGLNERILMELNRKDFQDMRWEEMWDTSLRIRNLFLKTCMPLNLMQKIETMLNKMNLQSQPVAVRSSAPEEDSATTSFAGLHESYLNICGADQVMEHIRLVWASLWSDRALLYRQDLRLDVSRASMAVIVQQMLQGQCSGVVFSQNPMNANQGIVEAVYGLNEGLVNGDIEPDHWQVERKSGKILQHKPPQQRRSLEAGDSGLIVRDLPENLRQSPPLNEAQVQEVYASCLRAEEKFMTPQDMEWTYYQQQLYTLQARPITTGKNNNPEQQQDERGWYLSLHRSFDNLKQLQQKITGELLPAMDAEAATLADINLISCTDEELALEIEKRQSAYDHWHQVYYEYFIPFAHGIRLFGEFYNDVMKPEDPFTFMVLLKSGNLESLERNQVLKRLALACDADQNIKKLLTQGSLEQLPETVRHDLQYFLASCGVFAGASNLEIGRFVAEAVSGRFIPTVSGQEQTAMQDKFLQACPAPRRKLAEEILNLGRASYKLRDDDNIHLGRIEAALDSAKTRARQRLEEIHNIKSELLQNLNSGQIVKALIDRNWQAEIVTAESPDTMEQTKKSPAEGTAGPETSQVRARQLTGQPAGPGLAKGRARVVRKKSDLFHFTAGEILVCDALDPNMTFVVPLASGVVERRGGMLIHGAIIAREYGLPCVTGISHAIDLITTGGQITVDGYLGIITIHT